MASSFDNSRGKQDVLDQVLYFTQLVKRTINKKMMAARFIKKTKKKYQTQLLLTHQTKLSVSCHKLNYSLGTNIIHYFNQFSSERKI